MVAGGRVRWQKGGKAGFAAGGRGRVMPGQKSYCSYMEKADGEECTMTLAL